LAQVLLPHLAVPVPLGGDLELAVVPDPREPGDVREDHRVTLPAPVRYGDRRMSRTGDPGLTSRPPADLDNPAVRAAAWTVGAALVLVAVFHFLLPRQVPYGILLYGLVTGSTYSLIAIGLILVYRANRIINFALAQIGVLRA